MEIITSGLEDMITYGANYTCYKNGEIYTILCGNKVLVSNYINIPHYRLEKDILKFIKPQLYYCPPLDYTTDYAAEYYETTDSQFLKTGIYGGHRGMLSDSKEAIEFYNKIKNPHTKVALYNFMIDVASKLGLRELLSIEHPSKTFIEQKKVFHKINNGDDIMKVCKFVKDIIIIDKFHKNIFGKEYACILKKYINEGFNIHIISSSYTRGGKHCLCIYRINEDWSSGSYPHRYLFSNMIDTLCKDFCVVNDVLKLKEPEQIPIPGLSWVWVNNDFKLNDSECNLSVLKARGGDFFKADLSKFSESNQIIFQFDVKPILNFIYHRETTFTDYKAEIKIADYLINIDYKNYILNYLAKNNLYGYYKIVNGF